MSRRTWSYFMIAVLCGGGLSGCDDDSTTNTQGDSSVMVDAGPPPDFASLCAGDLGHDIRCDNTAFSLGVRVRTDNAGNRIIYFRALPDIPTAPQDVNALKDYVEGGNDDLTWNNGYLYRFNRDSQTYTRYSAGLVNGDYSNPVLNLSPLSFSIKNLGFGTSPSVNPVYVSNELAIGGFNYGSPAGKAPSFYRWNPDTMTLLPGTINADLTKPNYGVRALETPIRDLFGDYVAFEVGWNKTGLKTGDGSVFYPNAVVGLIKTDGSEDVTFIEDTSGKCGLPWGGYGFVDELGDLYIVGANVQALDLGGMLAVDPINGPFLPPQPPSVCRIKKGTMEFDPTFYVDMRKPTNTCTFWSGSRVSGHTIQWAGMANEDCVGINGTTSYLNLQWTQYLIDLDTGTATVLWDIGKQLEQNGDLPFYVFGMALWQSYNSQAGVDSNGNFIGASTQFWGIDQTDFHVTKLFSTPAGDSYGAGLMTLR